MDLEERIHSIQRGDISQFEWIVEEYKNKIFSLAYGYTKFLFVRFNPEHIVKLYKNINFFQGQTHFPLGYTG